ncbi:hypothetical protein INT48_007692, partial [Thamnidium elegans]
ISDQVEECAGKATLFTLVM